MSKTVTLTRTSGREELATRLHSAALHLMRYVRTEDTMMGVGPAQASALSVVAFGGPATLNELARIEMVRPPTMSRIVDGLVRDGLVTRTVKAEDRRSIIITATPKGVRLVHEGRARRVKRLVELLESLDRKELGYLDEASKIVSRLLKITPHP